MTPDPPRSLLSTPATDPAKVAKALAAGADQVILDLEDSVAPSRKPDALQAALQALGRRRTPSRLSVRVNASGSIWQPTELTALAALAGEGDEAVTIIVPKVESAAELTAIAESLAAAERAAGREQPVRLQALIESARGLAAIAEIAAATPRLTALIVGYADLAASLGRALEGDPARWLGVQDTVLIAARSQGLAALDGPLLDTADGPTLRAACVRARSLGFDGKWVIHPRQLETANSVFSPSEQEVAEALELVAALERAETRGLGVLQVDGRMVDEAVARAAKRLLTRAGSPASAASAPGAGR